MLQLTDPTILFDKKRVYHVPDISPAKSGVPAPVKIVLVYRYPDRNLPAPLQQMLDKLVQACRFKTDDAAYINVNYTGGISLSRLQADFNAGILLFFGDLEIGGNLQKLKNNSPYTLNGVHILQAESLTALVGNDREKKSLWIGLQKVLSIV